MQLVSNALAQECAMGGLMMAYFMCVGWLNSRGTCSAVQQLGLQLLRLIGLGSDKGITKRLLSQAKGQQHAELACILQ
jgi:uncharacterized membrane protein (DUF2068 family)